VKKNRLKRQTLDATFSKLVRERASWCCQRCGKYATGQQLHCSHLISRRYNAIRWHPLNAVAHCASCHLYLGDRPLEFGRWIESEIGSDNWDLLKERAQTDGKYSAPALKDINDNLKASLEAMQMQRASGVQGRIEFEPPYSE
jgi:hypothetical protein